jgi:hypothetical protein
MPKKQPHIQSKCANAAGKEMKAHAPELPPAIAGGISMMHNLTQVHIAP